jgi:hypothetical protein
MKNFHRNLFQHHFTFLVVLLTLSAISFSVCNGQTSNAYDTKEFKNENFYFSLNLPNDWITSEATSQDSSLQLSSQSHDKRQSLSIYIIQAEDDIDLKKFADTYSNMFINIGGLEDTKKIREYLVFLKSIEKSYETNTQSTKLYFQVKDNIGYILMWQSLDKDFTNYTNIADTFNVRIPLLKTIGGWFKGIGAWIIGIIIALLGVGLLYLIGKTGQLVRKGVETKKALNKFKVESLRKGFGVNEKWHLFNKKSTFWIVLPVLGWVVVYFGLFYFLSSKYFLISLLALIPILLGYFGVIFGPSEDPDDYL